MQAIVCTGECPSPRFYTTLNAVPKRGSRGFLYFVVGGWQRGDHDGDLQCCASNVVHILDSDTWVWRRVQTTGVSPPGVVHHASATHGGKILVFGGCDDAGRDVGRQVFTLDPDTLAWTTAPAPLCAGAGYGSPLPHSSHTAVSSGGGDVLIYGGNAGRSALGNLWRYTPATGRFSLVRPVARPASPAARAAHPHTPPTALPAAANLRGWWCTTRLPGTLALPSAASVAAAAQPHPAAAAAAESCPGGCAAGVAQQEGVGSPREAAQQRQQPERPEGCGGGGGDDEEEEEDGGAAAASPVPVVVAAPQQQLQLPPKHPASGSSACVGGGRIPAPEPRQYHAACCARGSMYVYGGAPDNKTTREGDTVFGDLWRYDIQGNFWEEVCGGGGRGAPPPRGSVSMDFVEPCLQIYGGFDGKLDHATLHRFDLDLELWEEVPVPSDIPARWGHASAPMPPHIGGCLVFGGYSFADEVLHCATVHVQHSPPSLQRLAAKHISLRAIPYKGLPQQRWA